MSDGRVTLGDMARLRALFGALRAAEIVRPAMAGLGGCKRSERARPATAGPTPPLPVGRSRSEPIHPIAEHQP